MRINRIYQPVKLHINSEIELTPDAANHLITVLRLKINTAITLFNGDGFEYDAIITDIQKKSVTVTVNQSNEKNTESPLFIHLGQVISRGEKMDFTIQKAVELGVNKITPIISERCNVKLDIKRQQKRFIHWQKVIISACEQSGRTIIPALNPIISINDWIKQCREKSKLILHPHTDSKNSAITSDKRSTTALLIGPEGGFSETEIQLAKENDFRCLQLGPRILRTETAALAAIAVLQATSGDFSV